MLWHYTELGNDVDYKTRHELVDVGQINLQ